MLFAILSAVIAYRRAKDTGRNAILWAFIAAAVFIGTQLLVAAAAGLFLGLGIGFWGWSENIFDRFEIWITLLSIACSFVSTGIILWYLNRLPADNNASAPPPPPPPPNFNQ